MTVSYVGQGANAGTTVTIPTHQIGDLILIFAYRDGSNTAPSTPAAGGTVPAWNSIGSSGSNQNSSSFAWFTATDTTTTSGTWTNATELICLVYRGATIGASASGSGSATTSIAYPALTLQRTDSSSWVVGVAGHRTANDVDQAPSGMTNRASTGTEAAGHDTNGTVSSWSQQTVTVNASSAYRSWTVELRDKTISLGADLGKFFLPERNFIRWSEEFNNSYWGKTQVGTALAPVVTANHAIAPDGTPTADRVVFDLNGATVTGDRSDLQAGTATPSVLNKTYVFSVWLKTTDGSTVDLQLSHNGNGLSYVSVTGSWQRFSSVAYLSFDTSRRPRLSLRVGVPTSAYASLHVWGFQWEEGTAITDYDPTEAAGAINTPLIRGRNLVADKRTFSITSNDASVIHNARLAADVRATTVTRNDANVLHNVRLVADKGIFTVTGKDATLTYAPSTGQTLPADAGAFIITRVDAAIKHGAVVTADKGTFTVSPVNTVTFKRTYRLVASSRAFNINGIGANLIYSSATSGDKTFYYQTVALDPRKDIVTPTNSQDQLVFYINNFFRIL